MTPAQLEQAISDRSADVLRHQAKAAACADLVRRGAFRDEARRAAADVARLVAMRSPETVRAMERERGLA